MKLRQAPQGRLAQSQRITAQLIQSVELLQYGQAELEQFLIGQAERNPFLELRLPGGGGPGLPARTGAGALAAAERATAPEERVAARVTLAEHLCRQLGRAFGQPRDREIAREIIFSLDDDGYLRREPGSIAETTGATVGHVEAVLREVQRFEPAGIAARDLAECLRLQLEEKGWLTPQMAVLLDHLDLLARHDFRRLSTLCKASAAEILAMSEQIRSLDPRPGRRFDPEPVLPARPDVLVRSASNGSFTTRLNPEALPRVLVNREYASVVTSGQLGAEEKRYIADCMASARWLARKLDQRARTILRVATEIVAHQQEFLLHGPSHLRPLNMRAIADLIGVHPSTVSRAIAGKTMWTDRGLFEMGYFLAGSASASEGGAEVSAESVRHCIRGLIAGESADDVLSDDAIASRLRERGIHVGRRTVAKYREAMNLPSSAQRRRLKQASRMPAGGREGAFGLAHSTEPDA